MSEQNWSREKLIETWLMALEEPIGDELRAELNRQLAEHPHLRERLIQLSQEQSWLMWHGSEEEGSDRENGCPLPFAEDAAQASAELSALSAPPPAMPIVFDESNLTGETGTGGWLNSLRAVQWPLAIFLAVGTLASLYLLGNRKAAQETVSVSDGGALEGYVARVVRTSPDLTWHQPTAPLDFLLRIKSGDKLSLAKGLVQMEFAAGAKIILHGPAVFTPTSSTTGHLESGRLTGEVTEGNFHLTTPAAEVIDLGTLFGVQVDAEKSTDVVVFNGKVQVVDTAGDRELLDMTEGMAARIHSDGSKHFGIETQGHQFARSMPVSLHEQNRDELSVVDVLCGGNGFNASLSGAADPLTGQKDHGQRTPGIRRTNGAYHAVQWNPIIDGVFMPPITGQRTTIDSLGTTIDLPKNNGQTWGPLWARRWESTLQTAGATTDFWGRKTLKNILLRLKQSELGMIGMHANVGFTLDLRAVRLRQRRDVNEFRAIVTNLDNSEEEYIEDANRLKRTADLRVLVDGEVRYQRLGFRRADGDDEFIVKLKPGDRFLTVIAGDAEGDSSYDHVVLIDPVIALEPAEENARTSERPATAMSRIANPVNSRRMESL